MKAQLGCVGEAGGELGLPKGKPGGDADAARWNAEVGFPGARQSAGVSGSTASAGGNTTASASCHPTTSASIDARGRARRLGASERTARSGDSPSSDPAPGVG
jgi:hypothetical protein